MKSSTYPQMVEMSAPSTQRVIAFSRAAIIKMVRGHEKTYDIKLTI
jgi:hypothetical protein